MIVEKRDEMKQKEICRYDKKFTHDNSSRLYIYILLIVAFTIILSGCDSKNTDECYTPLNSEYVYQENEVCDICQYKNYTILLHENGYACYYCTTGELEEKELPLSGNLLVGRYQNLMYILDKDSNLICEIDLNDFSEKSTVNLGGQVGVINKFAAGKDYLILYGSVDDAFSFLVYNKNSGQSECVKTRLTVSGMTEMEDNKVILYISARSTSECYYTVYDMKTDTFQYEFHINESSGSDCTYCERTNSIKYYSIFDALYIKSLSIDSESVKTEKIHEISENGGAKISAYGNITVYMRNKHELFYIDDTKEKNEITIATVGYTIPTITALAREYSVQNDCLVSIVNFEDEEKYKLSLLAGDPIDCYLVKSSMNVADFVRNEAYVNLLEYEPFEKYVQENEYFWETMAQTDDGKIFGVPAEQFGIRDSVKSYASVMISRYLSDNVNFVKQTYSDEDGSELTALLNARSLYTKNGNLIPEDYPLFYEIRCYYFIMNPNSQNKDETAVFLAYAYERQSGTADGGSLVIEKYPQFEDGAYYYACWKLFDNELFMTVIDAIERVTEKNEDINTVVEQTAAQIKQIVLE